MMKIYQTRLGNLCTTAVVNGIPRRVQFIAQDGKTGIFSTEDEVLQQALEQSSGYGKRFTLLDVTSGEPVVETYTVVNEVETWQDARDYLRKAPYNLPDKELATSTLIEQSAERLHLIFPYLKKKKRGGKS